jgi:hypothetical protein
MVFKFGDGRIKINLRFVNLKPGILGAFAVEDKVGFGDGGHGIIFFVEVYFSFSFNC